MHELNLEQGAETQISCAVELLQIWADNKAIILAEMKHPQILSEGSTDKNYNQM